MGLVIGILFLLLRRISSKLIEGSIFMKRTVPHLKKNPKYSHRATNELLNYEENLSFLEGYVRIFFNTRLFIQNKTIKTGYLIR